MKFLLFILVLFLYVNKVSSVINKTNYTFPVPGGICRITDSNGIGTGTLLGTQIITAAHVIEKISDAVHIKCFDLNGKDHDLSKFVNNAYISKDYDHFFVKGQFPLNIRKKSLDLIAADIGIINLTKDFSPLTSFSLLTDENKMREISANRLLPTDNLFWGGYGIMNFSNSLPKIPIIALVNKERFKVMNVFLLDNLGYEKLVNKIAEESSGDFFSMPGDSGSPLYIMEGQKCFLIGLLVEGNGAKKKRHIKAKNIFHLLYPTNEYFDHDYINTNSPQWSKIPLEINEYSYKKRQLHLLFGMNSLIGYYFQFEFERKKAILEDIFVRIQYGFDFANYSRLLIFIYKKENDLRIREIIYKFFNSKRISNLSRRVERKTFRPEESLIIPANVRCLDLFM